MKYILCHYGEVGVKGKNRPWFEKKLVDDLRFKFKAFLPEAKVKVKRMWGRIVIELADDSQVDQAASIVKNTPGIVWFAAAEKTEADLDKVKELALAFAQQHQFETFKVETNRADKNFPLTSPEISRQVGGFVKKHTGKAPKMVGADLVIHLIITEDGAFVYAGKSKGMGGLPHSSTGRAVVLLSGGIDSPVAAYLMLKRGLKLTAVHFHSLPRTSPASLEKVRETLQKLNIIQPSFKLYLVPLLKLQEEIVKNCPAKLRIVLQRRLMMRIASKIAQKEGAEALITGESLGQVASQTLTNMGVIAQAAEQEILRPLLALDKQEIVEIAKQIGTYEISIRPHEDCCALFVPDHPATKAKWAEVEEAEAKLDIERLVQQALDEMEVEEIDRFTRE